MEYEDIIHGTIVLPDFVKTIIETPQFQRLKKVRRLACTPLHFRKLIILDMTTALGIIFRLNNENMSYLNLNSRTYYLANKTIDCLEKNTKNLHVPDFYRKVVVIAALLHDIGHGPFSHTWESVNKEYHHEKIARECIDEIFKVVSIDWGDMSNDYALTLIKGLIDGESSCLEDKNYSFLFEIVNNKQCDVDVDKWDYLKRDNVMMKASAENMDFDDVFINARASDDRAHIEYRYIDYPKIYRIFEIRSTFRINHYRSPKVACLDQVLRQILTKAENLKIDGIDIMAVRSKDAQAFIKLHNEEVWRILEGITSPPEVVKLVHVLKTCGLSEISPSTEEEKASVPEFLKVDIVVPFAGAKMKKKIFYFTVINRTNQISRKKWDITKLFRILQYRINYRNDLLLEK